MTACRLVGLSLLNTIIRLAAGIAGGLALIAGIILLVRQPRQDPQNPGPAGQRSSRRAASSR